MKIICCDFDNTIAEAIEPYTGEVGELFQDADYYINRLYDEGYYIIIWTCRAGEGLVKAKNWLDSKGINYHKINENADWEILGYKPLPKVYYDVLIDDKILGGLPLREDGKPDWERIYIMVRENI